MSEYKCPKCEREFWVDEFNCEDEWPPRCNWCEVVLEKEDPILIVSAHCYNDSKAKYTIRVDYRHGNKTYIGMDALNFLDNFFSRTENSNVELSSK